MRRGIRELTELEGDATSRLMGWVSAVGLAVVVGGCATAMPEGTPPTPPSEELRAKLGRVAVRAVEGGPEPVLQTPAAGPCSGMARGAGAGALAPVTWVWEHPGGGDGYGYALLLSIAMAPVAALIGAIHGGFTARSAAEVEEETRAVLTAWREGNPTRAVAERVAAGARERAEVEVDEKAETILEIGPAEARFVGPWSMNPPVQLALVVPVRLRRALDGALLYEMTLVHSDFSREFSAWAANDAAAARTHFRGSIEPLAETIVERIFLLYVLPERSSP